jgi:membrane-associated protein
MDNFPDFFYLILNSEKLIAYGGLTLLLLIVFAETGLFFGFIFPGDALLFSAGLLCGTQAFDVNILVLIFSVTSAAFLGNAVGYISGKIFGKKLFAKEDSFFFKKRYLEKTKQFYDKYGGPSLIAGRFLPIVRTFVPIFAGAIDMNFFKFSLYNLIGAVLWIWTLIPLGYFLGKQYPGLTNKLEYIILGFVLITTIILIRGAKKLKTKKQIEINKI